MSRTSSSSFSSASLRTLRRESFSSCVISWNRSTVRMTWGVIRMMSSVRWFFRMVAPNRLPRMGMSERKGMPPRDTSFLSRMRPAMATVSPSLTDRVVMTLVLEKVGAVCPSPNSMPAPMLLTSWVMSRVTDPEAEIRGTTMREMPVSRYCTLVVLPEVVVKLPAG